ncbi:MAG: hypothetical protein KGI45_01515 [Patescibacteria group bacterium]|nr:hypothetical protein [Patescibacteria group bacterium]
MTEQKLVIPGVTDPARVACIARARKYSQYVTYVNDALAGKCTICSLDSNRNPNPERRGFIEIPGVTLWRIWHCNPPEKFTRLHFLMSPVRHITDSRDLDADEWDQLKSIWNSLPAMFNFNFRGILIRDGDATQSAGTIQHLHIHMMVPDGTGRVESPFCKTPEEEAAGVARAIIFEKLRTTGMNPSALPPEEFELVKDRLI